jgi:hypothetical protein
MLSQSGFFLSVEGRIQQLVRLAALMQTMNPQDMLTFNCPIIEAKAGACYSTQSAGTLPDNISE